MKYHSSITAPPALSSSSTSSSSSSRCYKLCWQPIFCQGFRLSSLPRGVLSLVLIHFPFRAVCFKLYFLLWSGVSGKLCLFEARGRFFRTLWE